MEQASFHQLVLSDEGMAILNNRHPPGGDSGFHAHHRDLFAVVIESSSTSAQVPDRALAPSSFFPAGALSQGAIGDAPRVHRIVNSDKGMFQTIVIELRRTKPRGVEAATRDTAPLYEQVADHPRMRTWRPVIEPGLLVPTIT